MLMVSVILFSSIRSFSKALWGLRWWNSFWLWLQYYSFFIGILPFARDRLKTCCIIRISIRSLHLPFFRRIRSYRRALSIAVIVFSWSWRVNSDGKCLFRKRPRFSVYHSVADVPLLSGKRYSLRRGDAACFHRHHCRIFMPSILNTGRIGTWTIFPFVPLLPLTWSFWTSFSMPLFLYSTSIHQHCLKWKISVNYRCLSLQIPLIQTMH